MLKKGINGFQIKIIALIFMVLDHLNYFFVGIIDFPAIFSMLGRLSAPLFIFSTVNSMIYTSNREKYLLRLWTASVFMEIFNDFMNIYFPLSNGGILINNIFATLFVISLIIYSIQKIKESIKNNKSFIGYVFLMIVPILTSIVIFLFISNQKLVHLVGKIMMFFPSILFVEGGIVLVLLGVGLYLCNQSKKKITIFYLILCLVVLFTGFVPGEEALLSMFVFNIQWMMVFALPFMLMYNKQKGYGMKYLFYVFYPLHIYIFAVISNKLSKIL